MTSFDTDLRIAATLTELRAEVAIAEENLRIAIKHRNEAAEREGTRANRHAYEGACKWVTVCRKREQEARAALIKFALAAE